MPTKSRNRRSPKRLARRMKPTRHLSRRKGSGKKGSARARNPKKMRGGVTRRRLSQLTQQELFAALEELPADVVKQIGKRHPLLIPPFTMESMFRGARSFNQPLNNWNVSNVKNMINMFNGASSFNQPLNKWNVGKSRRSASRSSAPRRATSSRG